MTNNNIIQVGKYLITPLTKALGNGWFASSVSIRSGTGRGTTDRVLRLARLSRTEPEAVQRAIAEAHNWVGAT